MELLKSRRYRAASLRSNILLYSLLIIIATASIVKIQAFHLSASLSLCFIRNHRYYNINQLKSVCHSCTIDRYFGLNSPYLRPFAPDFNYKNNKLTYTTLCATALIFFPHQIPTSHNPTLPYFIHLANLLVQRTLKRKQQVANIITKTKIQSMITTGKRIKLNPLSIESAKAEQQHLCDKYRSLPPIMKYNLRSATIPIAAESTTINVVNGNDSIIGQSQTTSVSYNSSISNCDKKYKNIPRVTPIKGDYSSFEKEESKEDEASSCYSRKGRARRALMKIEDNSHDVSEKEENNTKNITVMTLRDEKLSKKRLMKIEGDIIRESPEIWPEITISNYNEDKIILTLKGSRSKKQKASESNLMKCEQTNEESSDRIKEGLKSDDGNDIEMNSQKNPVKSKGVSKTKKKSAPRKKKQPGKVSLSPPPDWEKIYSLVEELRSDKSAPVDDAGGEVIAERNEGGEIFRFQILIALMLSSQTKDATVAEAMVNLKKIGCDVNTINEIPDEKLNECIYKVGFRNNKTKYIKKTVKILIEKYHGDIPKTANEMMKDLPGVGPKMAYIVENIAWGKQSGIGVDTHMHRIFNQLHWVNNTKTPEKTRVQLESWLPKEKWSQVNYLWVGFGQEVQQFKPKILMKAVTKCSRPYEALKLLKKVGVNVTAEADKIEIGEKVRQILKEGSKDLEKQ